jgi:hypothetical protein
MGFLGQFFFGKKEKEALLVHIPFRLVSSMDAMIYLHNSNSLEMDHINYDDIVEAGVEFIVRQSLTVHPPEPPTTPEPTRKPKKQNSTPVYYVEDHIATSRGRSQMR